MFAGSLWIGGIDKTGQLRVAAQTYRQQAGNDFFAGPIDTINGSDAFPNSVDLTHVANASLTYSLNNFKIGLGINWHSGRAYTEPSDIQIDNNPTIEYDSPNNARLPDYFRTDISAIYKFNVSKGVKAEAGASLWNVFDRSNVINRFYTFDADDSIVEVDNRSLRFTPNFSLRIQF